MEFYARMAATADRMLKSKGQSVTLSRQSAGSYNPSTSAATITTSTQTGTGAVIEYANKNVDGVLIKTGDKRLLLSAIGITAPQLNDTVTVGGTVYTIVSPLKQIAPAGTVVMYDCNLRGAA